MQIGELAKTTGLAPSRIRFYERIGLLKTVHRQANGYRRYPPEAVAMLRLITTAQQAGFSLDELRTLLPVNMANWDHHALLTALQQKLKDINTMQQQLSKTKSMLQRVLTEVEARPTDMDCAANAKRVLSQFGFSQPSGTEPT